MQKVYDIFKPSKMNVTIMANKVSKLWKHFKTNPLLEISDKNGNYE